MATETLVGGPDDGEDKYRSNGTDRQRDGAEKSLMELVEEHDGATASLLKTLEDIATDPTRMEAAAPVVNKYGASVLKTFHLTIEQLAKEYGYDSDQLMTSVCTLWLSDEVGRIEFLNKIAPESNYIPMYEGNPEAMKQGILAQYEGYLESAGTLSDDARLRIVVGMYGASINSDIAAFVEALKIRQYLNPAEASSTQPEVESEIPQTPMVTEVSPKDEPSKKRAIGKHALDVAKLAAGVGLGIVLGNLGRRNRP